MAVTPAHKPPNPDASQRAADGTNLASTADGEVFMGFTNVTTATSASSGAGSTPPTDVAGYVLVNIGGNLRKIAFYEA